MEKTWVSNVDGWKAEINKALEKYDVDNVDIMLDEETGWLYIGYHSDSNSFPISNLLAPKDGTKLRLIKQLSKEYGIGYCI